MGFVIQLVSPKEFWLGIFIGFISGFYMDWWLPKGEMFGVLEGFRDEMIIDVFLDKIDEWGWELELFAEKGVVGGGPQVIGHRRHSSSNKEVKRRLSEEKQK